MNYVSLLETVHNRQLKARAIDRLVETKDFESLWQASEQTDQDAALWFIKNLALEKLKDWMLQHPKRDIDNLKYTELVALAKQKGIRNYSRLTKAELIRALKYDKGTTNRTNAISNPRNESPLQEG